MPDFPANLVPVGRTFTAGVFPHTALRLLSGRESRIRHSSTVVGHSLRVSFTMLTTAEMISIREHYADQLGGFLPFNIPDDLLSGVDTPADFTPSGHRWLYDGPPKVTDVPIEDAAPLNRHNVELAIKTIPPANAIAAGARWRARVTWRPGPIITAGVPLQLLATATWSPGLPSVRAPGATYTATATWTAGRPSHIPGMNATATATWSPGGINYYFDKKLALLFEGTNGSTTFVDSSSNNASITAVNGATISTAQFAQGTASGLFVRASATYLSVGGVAALNVGTGNFKISFRVRFVSGAFSGQQTIMQTTGNGFYMAFYNKQFYVGRPNVSDDFWTSSLTLTNGVWYTFELERVGTTATVKQDGTTVGTFTGQGAAYNLGSSGFVVGVSPFPNNGLDAYLDELVVH